MSNIIFEDVEQKSKVELPENLIFGRNFTDHMFEMDYDPALGWHNPTIKKFSDLSLSPATMALHYAQSVFEGMKVYKQDSGKIAFFRPDQHFKRLNQSSRRMCIPEIDEKLLIDSMKELVRLDKDWIPTKEGHALYIRPLIIATDPFIGVRESNTYKYLVILSPVGPYYPEGFKPVPILATDKYVRSVRKGVGDCKTPGNYGASLAAQREAAKEGYTQVLWLDAIDQKYIEEVGTMNIFINLKDEVVTPPLTGSILPGITRMSVIQILEDWKYNVNQRKISIDEVIDAYNNNNLLEIFGTGTAAVISSLSKLKYHDTILEFSSEEAGELGTKLYNEITGIEYGRIKDRYNWIYYLD